MSEQTEIQYNLVVNSDMTHTEIRKLEIVLIRCLNYAQMLTGDPNLKKGIRVMEQAIVTLRSLQMAMRAVEMASGPIGWAYAATSIVAAGMSGYSIYETMIGV